MNILLKLKVKFLVFILRSKLRDALLEEVYTNSIIGNNTIYLPLRLSPWLLGVTETREFAKAAVTILYGYIDRFVPTYKVSISYTLPYLRGFGGNRNSLDFKIIYTLDENNVEIPCKGRVHDTLYIHDTDRELVDIEAFDPPDVNRNLFVATYRIDGDKWHCITCRDPACIPANGYETFIRKGS